MKMLIRALLCLTLLYGYFESLSAKVWQPEIFGSRLMGDDCSSATALPVGANGSCSLIPFTNVDATPSGYAPPNCNRFGSGEDNWFSVTMPSTGSIVFELTPGSSLPPLAPADGWGVVAYVGSCGTASFVQIACDLKRIANGKISMDISLNPGVEVYFRVYERGNNGFGQFFVCARENCSPPNVSFTTRNDCNNNRFYVDVDVTSMGSESAYSLSDDQGGGSTSVPGTGTYSMGPYASGGDVNLTLNSTTNSLCIVESGPLNLDCNTTDYCVGSRLIPVNTNGNCSSPVGMNNVGATASGASPDPDCNLFPGEDQWVRFVVPSNGTFVIELRDGGSAEDLGLQLYSGSCGNLTQLGGCRLSFNGDGLVVILSNRTPGEVIYGRLWNFGVKPAQGYSLCAYVFVSTVANDFCEGATELSVSATGECTVPYTDTNDGVTPSGTLPEAVCVNNLGYDNWYKFTVPATGAVRVEMSSAGGPDDWALQILSGDCNNLTSLNCESLRLDAVINRSSAYVSGQTPGDVLYARVLEIGSNLDIGDFNICAYTCVPPTYTATVVPDCDNLAFSVLFEITDLGSASSLLLTDNQGSDRVTVNNPRSITMGPYLSGSTVRFDLLQDNDDCEERIERSYICNDFCETAFEIPVSTDGSCSQPVATQNRGSTPSNVSPNPSCGDIYQGHDNWFRVTVPETGEVTVAITGGGRKNWGVQLYDGSCSGLSLVKCRATGIGGSSFPSVNVTGRTPGETLFVRVFANPNYTDSYIGNFSICAYTVCEAPAVDFTVREDCDFNRFYIDAAISDVGSSGSVTIDDRMGTITVSPQTGTEVFGPYTEGTIVRLDVYTGNATCDFGSGPLTFRCSSLCDYAIPLDPPNESAMGLAVSHIKSGGEPSGCPGPDMGPGLWFTFTSSGELLTLTADPSASNWDIKIALFSGSCLNPICEATEDSAGPGGTESMTFSVSGNNLVSGGSTRLFAFVGGDDASELPTGTLDVSLSGSVLPLDLLSFTAATEAAGNRLQWVTANEVNTAFFSVERLETNSRASWTSIGQVQAAGNFAGETKYQFLDERPLEAAYYRLKMEDVDETFSYSPTVFVGREERGEVLKVYPNPAGSTLFVDAGLPSGESGRLSIYDSSGRKVGERVLPGTRDNQAVPLDITTLPSGLYWLRLETGHRQSTTRFLKN